MKTTIDIADDVLAQSRDLAQRERITLRQLVEEGLRGAIAHHAGQRRARVRPVTVKGHGLSPEFQRGGWAAVRDAAYEGRGT